METNSLNTSALVTADSPKGQRATETFRAQYNKAGLNKESAQILNENPGFATYLLTGIKHFSDKYELVRTILGKDFISPEDVMNSRKGITYTDEQLAYFRKTVPAQEIIEWGRDNNHILVAGPNHPMSLIDIRNLNKDDFYPSLEAHEAFNWWYTEERQKFAQNDTVKVVWYMVNKKTVPGSVYRSWNNQIALLSDFEFVPNAAELVWAITSHKAVRGTYLFSDICSPYKSVIRTSSVDSINSAVHLCACKGGIDLNSTGGDINNIVDIIEDDNSYSDRFIQLSSARKLC